MNITTSFDDNYTAYAIVMLTSFLINNPGHHAFYLLDHGLSEKSITMIEKSLGSYDVEIVRIKADFGKFEKLLPVTENWTIVTYSTLIIQDILPESVTRILYLDADTIVNGSLDELYSMDFGNDRIIACIDSNGKNKLSDYSDIQQSMMGDDLSNYFNTGCMLMNLEAIREVTDFEGYAKVMEKWQYKMTALEQDILNCTHKGHVSLVPWEKYDLFARMAYEDGTDLSAAAENASVIHYAGVKPWQNATVHYDLEKIWWDYAKKTNLYEELSGRFIDDLCSDHRLEDGIKKLTAENRELKALVDKMYGIMKQLNIK